MRGGQKHLKCVPQNPHCWDIACECHLCVSCPGILRMFQLLKWSISFREHGMSATPPPRNASPGSWPLFHCFCCLVKINQCVFTWKAILGYYLSVQNHRTPNLSLYVWVTICHMEPEHMSPTWDLDLGGLRSASRMIVSYVFFFIHRCSNS